jgi:2-keto-4-pentenoate hydratase/2-oxohepta-3-ene-1,7-dioic acid hydratase in catechol pathway
MRWVARHGGDGRFEGLGLVERGEVRFLDSGARLIDCLGTEGGLAQAAQSAHRRPRAVHPIETLNIGPPIDRPPSIRDFSAFEKHIVTIANGIGFKVPPAWYEIPGFYFSNPGAVVGPDDDVAIPAGSSRLDYELEVALVVGHHNPRQLEADPMAAIAGLVIMNDWSARDLQERELSLGLGPVKSKDFATSLGPVFVTLDELEPHRTAASFDLDMIARVNGVQYSAGSLADIYHPLADLVRYAARNAVLEPGDVIGSGTCGTGCILELSLTHGGTAYPWLKAGDVVELEVAELGTLRNRIVERTQPWSEQ